MAKTKRKVKRTTKLLKAPAKGKRVQNPIEREPEAPKLTVKQSAFCQFYVLNGGNGTKAARDAGYECENPWTYNAIAFENLTKPYVIAEIARVRKVVGAEFNVTAEEVIGGLREVRKRGLQEEPVFDREGNPTGFYKSDLGAANRSLELLGKTVGMFVDRSEVSGADGAPLTVTIHLPDNGRDAAAAETNS